MEFDLGVAVISVRVNYKVEVMLSSSWDKWRQGTYPDRQVLAPITWTSESYFVNAPHDQLPAEPLSIIQALKAYQSCELHPEWETNPLLRVPRVVRLMNRAIRSNGNSFYISRDYILIVDNTAKLTCEFYKDEARKRTRSKDIVLLLVPFIKYTLPLLRSVFIHANGVLTQDRRAVIFLAPSGGGKTTVARLARKAGYKILGDDRILITQRNGAYVASSVPFNRITDGPDWGRVGAFVILKKGASFSVAPASPIDVLPKIWADNLGQWYSLSSASKRMLFSLYSDMFSNVPVYEMTFEKDYVDWAAIESVLETD